MVPTTTKSRTMTPGQHRLLRAEHRRRQSRPVDAVPAGHALSGGRRPLPLQAAPARHRAGGRSLIIARRDRLLRRLGARELGDDAALAHDQDAVAHAHHLRQLAGDHQDRHALPAPARSSGGGSRPWRRRRCRASARPGSAPCGLLASHLPSTTFCWLPPDSLLDDLLDAAGADAELLDARRAPARVSAARSMKPSRATRRAAPRARCSRGPHRPHQALRAAILRHVGDAEPLGLRRARDRRPACRRCGSRRCSAGVMPKIDLRQFAAPGADQAGEPDDLARAQRRG